MRKHSNQSKPKRLIPSDLWDSTNDLPFLSNCPKSGQNKFVSLIKKSPNTQPWQPQDDLVEWFHEKFPLCDCTTILNQLQFEAVIVRNEILEPFNASKGLTPLSALESESPSNKETSPLNPRKRKDKWDYIHPEALAWSELQRDRKGLYTSYYRES